MSKYKLINDPVHGFITISNPIVFQILEHKYFQRLRRISQMGMANYVYPGTQHTRFHHALGAMHLMQKAIYVLRNKGIEITEQEEDASLAAILLHDVGHGPYSHALEYVTTEGINHEFYSDLIMNQLNHELNGALSLAIKIFNNQYEKKFLHQLVSSQLDVDRLDYLARDSFFSGVYEGKISTERIISMLNVFNNQLVVEEKGLYSIEKYIVSRRLMYWQVYLHKTAISAEQIMVSIIRRAKYLAQRGELHVSSKPLQHFLQQSITKDMLMNNPTHLQHYTQLDDYDVMFSIKEWQAANDFVLSYLCKCIVNRNLFHLKLKRKPIQSEFVAEKREQLKKVFNVNDTEIDYLLLQGSVSNTAYKKGKHGIQILLKSNKIKDLGTCSEQLKSKILKRKVEKHYIAYPKILNEYEN